MNSSYKTLIIKVHILEGYVASLKQFIAIIEDAMEIFYEDDMEKRFIWEDHEIFAPQWENLMRKQQVHDLHHLYMELVRIETAITILKNRPTKSTKTPYRRPVRQYTKNMKLVKQYDSIAEAARATELSGANIHLACNIDRNSCGGFKWRYVIPVRDLKTTPWSPDREKEVLELISSIPKKGKLILNDKSCTDNKLQQMEKVLEEERFKGSSGDLQYLRSAHYSSSLHWARKKAIDKQKDSK